jgi:chemotaxis protein methyltransferase CheR
LSSPTNPFTAGETEGKSLYDLGNRQWDIPALRHLLENIILEETTVENYEVAHDFPHLGFKIMLLNARKIVREDTNTEFFLLAIDDITERRTIEAEAKRLSEQIRQASQEAAHRIKNSLMVLSSFIRIQRRQAVDDGAKQALNAIGARIDAVSRLYERLSHHAELGELLPVRPYVDALCDDLRRSTTDKTGVKLECESDELNLDADRVVALGLAVNELVLNAAKHAFVDQRIGVIAVRLKVMNGRIHLTVRDDGIGLDEASRTDSGLGRLFLESFIERLQGDMTVDSSDAGTSVSISLPMDPSGH